MNYLHGQVQNKTCGILSIKRLGLLVLLAFSGSIFFSGSAYAAFSASVSGTNTINFTEVDTGNPSIRPSAAGVLGVGSDRVSVTTDCTAGYSLYVTATDTGGTSLKRSGATAAELTNPSNVIVASSTATGSETTLAKDTWGVGKIATAFAGLQEYRPDMETLTPLYTGLSNSEYDIYYGVNVSTAKTPGTYTGEVLYTVVMDDTCLKYTLNFDGGEATGQTGYTNNLTSQMVNFKEAVDLATISSKSKIAWVGHVLTGWKDQNNNTYGTTGTIDVNPNDISTITLTAQWEISSNAVTVNKGTNVSTVSGAGTYNYDSNITISATAFATGYHFGSWTVNSGGVTLYSDSNMTTQSTTTATAYFKMPDEAVTVTANAAANSYTFSYNANGATGSPAKASNTGTYGSTMTTSAIGTMAKTGYHLLGWSTSSTATSATCNANASCSVSTLAANAGKTGASDNGATITLYAVWAVNTFTINYSANGGTGAASKTSETATYGVDITMPAQNTLDKESHEFLGWSLSSTATAATWTAEQTRISPTAIKSDVATTSGGNATVYAVWKYIPYMQTTACASLPMGETSTLVDKRDNQEYTVYRWPDTGTAGTAYPTNMAGYCIMTKDLALGYVTGGSVTKGANLVLTADDSAAAGTITGRTKSNWSSSNSDSNLQYANGTGDYASSHYSWGAAKRVCSKGWSLPSRTQYNNIITLMGGNSSSGSSKIRGAPYNFTRRGRLLTSGWTDAPSVGWYWSSTQNSSTTTSGSDMKLTSSVLQMVYSDKRNGDSVRCIQAP